MTYQSNMNQRQELRLLFSYFFDICAPMLIVLFCSICASNVLTNIKLITSLEIVKSFKARQVYLKTQSIILSPESFI